MNNYSNKLYDFMNTNETPRRKQFLDDINKDFRKTFRKPLITSTPGPLLSPSKSFNSRKYSLADVSLTPMPSKQIGFNKNDSCDNNLRTYIDCKSPGYAGRVVQYSKEQEKSFPVCQSKYGKPGVFPIVHLSKSELPILKKRSSQMSMRINSSELAKYNSPEQNRMLMERIVASKKSSPEVNTRSVLDALKEISRKRIHSSEEELILNGDGKRRRMDGFNANGASSNKRSNDSSTYENKSGNGNLMDELMASHTSMDESFVQPRKKEKRNEHETNLVETIKESKFIDVETQTNFIPTESKAIDTQLLEEDKVITNDNKLERVLKKSPVKIFDEKPLEIMRKNRLSVLMGSLKKSDKSNVDNNDKVKTVETNENEKKTEEKPLVSILSSTTNKSPVKTTKHVSFDIPQSINNSTSAPTTVPSSTITCKNSDEVPLPAITATSLALTTPIISSTTKQMLEVTKEQKNEEIPPEKSQVENSTTKPPSFSMIQPLTKPVTAALSFNFPTSVTSTSTLQVPPALDAKIITSATVSSAHPTNFFGFGTSSNNSTVTTSIITSTSTSTTTATPSFKFDFKPATAISTAPSPKFGFGDSSTPVTKTEIVPSKNFFGTTSTAGFSLTKTATTNISTIPASTNLNTFSITSGLMTGSTPTTTTTTTISSSFGSITTSSIPSFNISTNSTKPMFTFGNNPNAKSSISFPSTNNTVIFPISTTSNIFPVSTTNATGSGIFSSTTSSNSGMFPSTTSTTSTGLFSSTTTSSTAGFFSSAASTANTGIFAATTNTAVPGMFASVTNTPSTGIFAATTTSSTMFPSTTSSLSKGIFPTSTTSGGFMANQNSAFANKTVLSTLPQPTTTQQNLTFGVTVSTSLSKPITSIGSSTPSSFTPIFGLTKNEVPPNNISTFGVKPTFNSNLPFGNGNNNSQDRSFGNSKNIFGTVNAASASSIFTTSNNLVSTTNTFTTVTSSSTSGVFGMPSGGFGTSNFGSNPTSTFTNNTFGSKEPFSMLNTKPTTGFGTSSTATPATDFSTGGGFNQPNSTFGSGTVLGGSTSFEKRETGFGVAPFGSSTTNNNNNNNNTFGTGGFTATPTTTQSEIFTFGSTSASKPPVFSFGTSEPPKASFNFSSENNPASNIFGSGGAPQFGSTAPVINPAPAPQFNMGSSGTPGMFNIGTGSSTPTRSRTQLKAKRRT